jgi:hypothetical protein
MPIAEVIIPKIQKTPITREIVHGHGVSWGRSTTTWGRSTTTWGRSTTTWGRSTTTVDDCAIQEEDATPVA